MAPPYNEKPLFPTLDLLGRAGEANWRVFIDRRDRTIWVECPPDDAQLGVRWNGENLWIRTREDLEAAERRRRHRAIS